MWEFLLFQNLLTKEVLQVLKEIIIIKIVCSLGKSVKITC